MIDTAASRPDALDEALANIGALVVYMQATERVIASALSHALPQASARTADQLAAEIAANNKATLGALLRKLKERVDLDDDFALVFEAYLAERNALIHDISRIPGFDLNTDAGIRIANRFLSNLRENAEAVTKVFLSLITEWGRPKGL